jgi:integrase
MAEDAITDEVADLNPFKGLRIRANDPRATKGRRPIRVFSFDQMHAFTEAAGSYEPMIRVLTDTGMRLGEVLALHREDFDGERLIIKRTAHEGKILEGTKTDHGEPGAPRNPDHYDSDGHASTRMVPELMYTSVLPCLGLELAAAELSISPPPEQHGD